MAAFILQRFYYSLASGFIINLFVILNFYVLDKKDFLPRYIKFIKDISMPEILSVVIFIIAVIMVGIFIEGINESCFQYYGKLHSARKAFVPKKRNPEENRRTFLAFLLWHIFRRVGIRYVRDVGRWYKAIKISGERIIMPNKGEKPCIKPH